jgi:hypothetical protein
MITASAKSLALSLFKNEVIYFSVFAQVPLRLFVLLLLLLIPYSFHGPFKIGHIINEKDLLRKEVMKKWDKRINLNQVIKHQITEFM